jgi:hypothetical protein
VVADNGNNGVKYRLNHKGETMKDVVEQIVQSVMDGKPLPYKTLIA